MNFTEMKVGSEYKLRNGELVKCVAIDKIGGYPVVTEDFNKDRMRYTLKGKFCMDDNHPYDAVEEISKKTSVLLLEVGKKYVFEDGKIGEVVSEDADGTFFVDFKEGKYAQRSYFPNGKKYFSDNPHGAAVKEFQSGVPTLPRHKNADLILEHARQKAEGELAAGWWVWKLNKDVSIVPESMTLNDKDTVYSYEKSDQHPDNVNSIENKLNNVKIGSQITAGKNVFVVYENEYGAFVAFNKSANIITAAYYTLGSLVARIETYGKITEVVL